MASDKVYLWRWTFSHAHGYYWLCVKTCDADNANAWLAIFQKDESTATYKLGVKVPKSIDKDAARLVATL